jgi:hypothetical protein
MTRVGKKINSILHQLGLLGYASSLGQLWRSLFRVTVPEFRPVKPDFVGPDLIEISQPRPEAGGESSDAEAPAATLVTTFENTSFVPSDDRFDYLFVLAGNAGSLATQNILAVHPDVVVVPRLTLDAAMSNWGGISLASMHEEMLPIIRHCRRSGKKACLVVHRVDYLRDSKVMQELARIVSPDGLVLIVRNPVKALLSDYNHSLFHQFGYHFATNNLPWFSEQHGQKPIDVPTTNESAVSKNAAYTRTIDLSSVIPPMDIWTRYFELFSKLSEHFHGKKRVLDADVLVGERIVELYKAAGLSEKFCSTAVDRTYAGRADRYMTYNAIDACVFGGKILRMRLFTGGASQYDHDQSRPGSVAEYFSIASIPVSQSHRLACSLPLPERIDLGVHIGGQDWGAPWHPKQCFWFELPLYERRFLQNAGYIETLLDVLVRQWVVNVSETERALAPYRLDRPSTTLIEAGKWLFNEDTRHLVELYPDQLGNWVAE